MRWFAVVVAAAISVSNPMEKVLSENEIDQLVVTEADDDSKWEAPIHVRRSKRTTLHIPAELAARAAFLARLHRKASLEEWLTHVIQERVELEEAVFAGVKRDLALANQA
jgi:hypothetical protein